MAKTQPWYSIKENVYHNDTSCSMANSIESEYIKPGTGRRPLCKECARIYIANLR